MSPKSRAPSTVGPCLVWLLSAAPFLIEPFLAPGRLAGVSRAALAALPFIAWAGLPRSSSAAASPSAATGPASLVNAALFDLAICLPPIALGSWIDLASGVPRGDVLVVAVSSAVLVLVLSLAARLAAGSRATSRWHAVAWLALVAGVPLLRGALELGGEPLFGPAPAWMAWLASQSPIDWIVTRLDPAATSTPWGALVLALALLSIGALAARSDARAEQPA